MKKSCILICLIAILTGCNNGKGNNTQTNIEKSDIKLEEYLNFVCDFSIGLGEKKIFPFGTESMLTISKNENNLYAKDVKISFDSNCNINEYLNFELAHNADETDNKIVGCRNAFMITCIKEFSDTITVSKVTFKTEKANYELNSNWKINFNEDYCNYPAFPPSYDPNLLEGYLSSGANIGSYNTRIVFGNYLILNFGWFYDLEKSSLIINQIRFSEELSKHIDGISFTIINEDVDWFTEVKDMITRDTFEEHSFTFEPIRTIDYLQECSTDKYLIYKVNYERPEDFYDVICGDIIFDVTINGNNYQIKDLFIYW